MNKIYKDDNVIVLTGKDKGKRGVVTKCIDAKYVLVDGINVAHKATKPNPMTGVTGGIVDKLMPIHISNIALFNVSTNKKDRVAIKLIEGKRVRVYKSSGESVKVQ